MRESRQVTGCELLLAPRAPTPVPPAHHGLAGRQHAHEVVVLHHLLHAVGQRDGDRQRQPLGHRHHLRAGDRRGRGARRADSQRQPGRPGRAGAVRPSPGRGGGAHQDGDSKNEELQRALAELAEREALVLDDPPGRTRCGGHRAGGVCASAAQAAARAGQQWRLCAARSALPCLMSSTKKQTSATQKPSLPMAVASQPSFSCSGVSPTSPTTSAMVRPHSLCSPTASTSMRPLPSVICRQAGRRERCANWPGTRRRDALVAASAGRKQLAAGAGHRRRWAPHVSPVCQTAPTAPAPPRCPSSPGRSRLSAMPRPPPGRAPGGGTRQRAGLWRLSRGRNSPRQPRAARARRARHA